MGKRLTRSRSKPGEYQDVCYMLVKVTVNKGPKLNFIEVDNLVRNGFLGARRLLTEELGNRIYADIIHIDKESGKALGATGRVIEI